MDKTKKKIIIAAKKIFSKKGYSQATIKNIAIEAGVARGLLHYHFKNKEDILLQVINSIYESSIGVTALDQLSAETPSELAAAVSFLLRESLRNSPEFFQLIYGILSVIRQNKTVRESMEAIWLQYREIGKTTIERWQKNGIITSTQPPAVILTLFVSVMHGLGIQVIGEPNLHLTESDELWRAVESNLLYILGNS